MRGDSVFCILILTNNISNEKNFCGKIQQLNYEVFCSTLILNYWRENNSLGKWEDYFPIVMLSETVSDLEASELVKSVASKKTAVFRIVDTSVDEQKAEILKNEGFQEWITKNESFNELRELLFIYSAKQINQEKENKENKSPSISSWKLLKIKLSPVEERILDVLIEAKAATVSREDLVKTIWREDPNNSNLSQVSYRIKRIKHSIEEVFDIPDGVVTDWRKGYRLNDEFYQKIYESYELA